MAKITKIVTIEVERPIILLSDWFELKFSLYLLPQDCSSSPLPLSISYDQATFTNKSSLTPNLTAGKACNYEITMNKSGLVVSNGTLTDWDKADMSSMPGEMEMGSN